MPSAAAKLTQLAVATRRVRSVERIFLGGRFFVLGRLRFVSWRFLAEWMDARARVQFGGWAAGWDGGCLDLGNGGREYYIFI